jgi:hypothetical protein
MSKPEKKQIKKELLEFAKRLKVGNFLTGRKRAIVEIGDLNPEIDLGMLIES